MRIKVNERSADVADGMTLEAARRQFKADADLVIYNGAPMAADLPLREGDEVVLIRRGEMPAAHEMESLMAARHTPGVHAAMKRACVGIAGLGGLGSAVAIALARIGVGRLILADFDVVEPSNLNRQQYFVDQIGLPKAEALRANLMRINPYVQYDTHAVKLTADNILPVFGAAQVMVEAFDRQDQKVLLMRTFGAGRPDVPLVTASGLAGYGRESTIGVRRMGRSLYVVGDLETGARPGCGLMAPRVGIVAHMQANLAVRLLLGDAADLAEGAGE